MRVLRRASGVSNKDDFQHKCPHPPHHVHAHSFHSLGFPKVTYYLVKCMPTDLWDHSCGGGYAGEFALFDNVSVSALPLQGEVSPVSPGYRSWVCYAIADNGVGGEQCSAASNLVHRPSAPTVVNVTSLASGRIDVSFTPSSDLGEPLITRYVVACLRYYGTTPACSATGDGVQSTSVAVGATPQASFFGLADGAQYVCYAIASNGVGGNACSAASAVTTVATWRLYAVIGTRSPGFGTGDRIWRTTNSDASWIEAYAPQASWTSIASSSDGSKLAAVIYGDRIWRSTDSGASWTEAYAPQAKWTSIASSSDGSKLAAVIDGDYRIWRSTNFGASWLESYAYEAKWKSIVTSADGSKLAAVSGDSEERPYPKGRIWRSTDSGASWTVAYAPHANWFSIASSSDGSKLAAVIKGDRIWRSTDSGASWTEAYAPQAKWTSIASSSDGSKLAAVIDEDRIWRSTDSGASWMETYAPQANWLSITSSSDGSKLAAVINRNSPLSLPELIWRSTDSGVSWTVTNAPEARWLSIASSA